MRDYSYPDEIAFLSPTLSYLSHNQKHCPIPPIETGLLNPFVKTFLEAAEGEYCARSYIGEASCAGIPIEGLPVLNRL